MPTFTLNGTEVTVDDGSNLIAAAAEHGVNIPHYCYHPDLNVVASCRICIVYREASGPGGRVMKGLVTACNTPAAEGMVVDTESDDVKKARQDVLEFLLINHPIDCPVCDQAGECDLQNYSFEHGRGYSRMTLPKRTLPTKELGSDIRLYTNRCILCDRCVRFLRDYVGTGELSVMNRGNLNEINIFPGRPIDNIMAGNVVDLCPVGALLSEDFLFKARVWNLRSTASVCPGCSKGCNTHLDQWNNEIQRIRPRTNLDVNGRFICDSGRELYKSIRSEKRLAGPQIIDGDKLVESSWDDALAKAADLISSAGSETIFVTTTHATNESMRALKGLADSIGSQRIGYIPCAEKWEAQEFPGGFTIPADRSPNTSGAELLMGTTLEKLLADGPSSTVAVVLNPSWSSENIGSDDLERLKSMESIIVIDVMESPLAEGAGVLLPGRLWAEERASFTNDKGMEQPFLPSVIGPEGTRSASQTLKQLEQVIATPASVEGATV